MPPFSPIQRQADERFSSTLAHFLEHARAVACGRTEGEAFNWFLATEYQWEMETACEWLLDSPVSSLSDEQKSILRDLLQAMPDTRHALEESLRAAADTSRRDASVEWPQWQTITALPSWKNFTAQTAIALSRLGQPPQNDDNYFARR